MDVRGDVKTSSTTVAAMITPFGMAVVYSRTENTTTTKRRADPPVIEDEGRQEKKMRSAPPPRASASAASLPLLEAPEQGPAAPAAAAASEAAAAPPVEESEEGKDEAPEDINWRTLKVHEVTKFAASVSKQCVFTEYERSKSGMSRLETKADVKAYSDAIMGLYHWLCAHLTDSIRIKVRSGSRVEGNEDDEKESGDDEDESFMDDVVDVNDSNDAEAEEEGGIQLNLFTQFMVVIAQCMAVSGPTKQLMASARSRLEEALIQLKVDGRQLQRSERRKALQHRLSREILTFHHAWRMPLNYKLIEKQVMRKHSELYEFEMREEQVDDFFRRNPHIAEERKKMEARPKPQLYKDQISAEDHKANPALRVVWDLSTEDFLWICASILAESATEKIDTEAAEVIRPAAWFMFHSNLTDQLFSLYPKRSLTPEESKQLTDLRLAFIRRVTQNMSLDIDAEARDRAQTVAFRLLCPAGINEYFAGNSPFNVDRFPVKVQKICGWLEPTRILEQGWLANNQQIGSENVVDSLIKRPDTDIVAEVQFFQSFRMLLTDCGINLEDFVIFGADVPSRYNMLWKEVDFKVPFRETRPQIMAFGKRFAVRLRRELIMCSRLWQACMLWLLLVEKHFYGKMSETGCTNSLSRSLGLTILQDPAIQVKRTRGKLRPWAPSTIGGGHSDEDEDEAPS